jgi:DNA-binding transcriptional LysR family regulator
VDVPVELRELRYFVAVAEELHFGRAAQRLHMSQSPLSRAIRDLERELGVALFVRTTRHVELTPAGFALLEGARRALAEIDGAIEEARRATRPDRGVLKVGYGPLSRATATRVVEALASGRPDLPIRLDEDTTPELLARVAAHDLDAAAVVETPAAARRYGVRVDALRDEPLLAAVPSSHRYAGTDAIPIGAFAAERVLLPREPSGSALNDWLRAVVRAAGFELERTFETPGAAWDHRLPLVAAGEAVAPIVADWEDEPIAGVAAVPFDPPLALPIDLVSSLSPNDGIAFLVETACRLRDEQGWLARRAARTELPAD